MDKSLLELLESEKMFTERIARTKEVIGRFEKIEDREGSYVTDCMQQEDYRAWHYYAQFALKGYEGPVTMEEYSKYLEYLCKELEKVRVELSRYFGMIINYMNSDN